MKCRREAIGCKGDATHYFTVSARKAPKEGMVAEHFNKWGYTAFCDECSANVAKNTFWQYTEISLEAYELRPKRFQ